MGLACGKIETMKESTKSDTQNRIAVKFPDPVADSGRWLTYNPHTAIFSATDILKAQEAYNRYTSLLTEAFCVRIGL